MSHWEDCESDPRYLFLAHHLLIFTIHCLFTWNVVHVTYMLCTTSCTMERLMWPRKSSVGSLL